MNDVNMPINSLLERQLLSPLSAEQLLRVPGEFTCEVRRADDVAEYFCSANGVAQLFYGSFGSHVCVGSTVNEVLRSSGQHWSWDYEAVGQMATFGHLIGNRTLHRSIKRLGAGELLREDARGFTISKVTNTVESTTDDPPNGALNALTAYVKAEGRDGDLVSISAGFDSRVILAAFLNLGIRPTLVVMGDAASTDVSIATRMAETLSLRLVRVPLDFRRMMERRSEISSMTSGTNTIDNWHTFDYVQACEVPTGATI
jgi:asparagine synthetase B (glutamine-hydrolysing)